MPANAFNFISDHQLISSTGHRKFQEQQPHDEDQNYRVYVDGAYKHNRGAIGRLIMKNNKIHLSWSLYIGASTNANYLEAQVVLESILKCNQLQLNIEILFTDSQHTWDNILHRVHSNHNDWEHLIETILEMI